MHDYSAVYWFQLTIRTASTLQKPLGTVELHFLTARYFRWSSAKVDTSFAGDPSHDLDLDECRTRQVSWNNKDSPNIWSPRSQFDCRIVFIRADRHGNGISHVSILGGSISPEHLVIHRQKQRVSTMSSTTKRLKDYKMFNAWQERQPATKSHMDFRFWRYLNYSAYDDLLRCLTQP